MSRRQSVFVSRSSSATPWDVQATVGLCFLQLLSSVSYQQLRKTFDYSGCCKHIAFPVKRNDDRNEHRFRTEVIFNRSNTQCIFDATYFHTCRRDGLKTLLPSFGTSQGLSNAQALFEQVRFRQCRRKF